MPADGDLRSQIAAVDRRGRRVEEDLRSLLWIVRLDRERGRQEDRVRLHRRAAA